MFSHSVDIQSNLEKKSQTCYSADMYKCREEKHSAPINLAEINVGPKL